MFKSRRYTSCFTKLKKLIWPSTSWTRCFKYIIKRVLRMRNTPHQVAAGFAAGVFVSFTPFLGFHFILGMLIAFILRGSIVASAIGTFIGNPLTFIPIWYLTYIIGETILGECQTCDFSQVVVILKNGFSSGMLSSLFHDFGSVLLTMCVGAIPTGTIAALIVYVLVYRFKMIIIRVNKAKRVSG